MDGRGYERDRADDATATADWQAELAVAEMTEAGAFGPGRGFVSYEPETWSASSGQQDNFASTVRYGTVTVSDGPLRHSHRLVMKLKHRSSALRELYRTDSHFHNETLFYERIAPFLLAVVPAAAAHRDRVLPPLCRYFYGRNEGGARATRDVIVLENAIAAHGYRMSEHRLHLDFGHLVVALNVLARFHALSYRAKHVDPTGYAEAISDVKDAQWSENDEWCIDFDTLATLFTMALDRLSERRRALGGGADEEDETACRFRTDVLDDLKRTYRRTMEPAEPLAVLCHGDYNRNNVMFLYDDGGRPVDALPFDMATVRYGSPALDLSFFLYMNTDRRTRDGHWDELLDAYCAALAAAVSDVTPAVRVPDRARLDAEMRERAFYGLVHASFFVRVMLTDHPVDAESVLSLNVDEQSSYLLSLGGDAATDVFADAVQHFMDIRYAAARNRLPTASV